MSDPGTAENMQNTLHWYIYILIDGIDIIGVEILEQAVDYPQESSSLYWFIA